MSDDVLPRNGDITKGKGRAAGEGHVRWSAKLKVHEARLYVPVKLRPLYGGKREISFYAKQESEALEKRVAARRDPSVPGVA